MSAFVKGLLSKEERRKHHLNKIVKRIYDVVMSDSKKYECFAHDLKDELKSRDITIDELEVALKDLEFNFEWADGEEKCSHMATCNGTCSGDTEYPHCKCGALVEYDCNCDFYDCDHICSPATCSPRNLFIVTE